MLEAAGCSFSLPLLCLASAAKQPLKLVPWQAHIAVVWGCPCLSEYEAVGTEGFHLSTCMCTLNPTSARRRGPAPHAVLPIQGSAVDGGLSMEWISRVARVCYSSAKEEFIQQLACVLPIRNVWRWLTRDTCRGAEQGF